MTIWTDLVKMVVISSLLSLGLSILAVLIVGSFDRTVPLVAPTPKWPLLLLFGVLWWISLKAGYWWVFQRWTFYPPQ